MSISHMLSQELWQHRLLMVTGKGGIGKSLITAVMGLAASQSGRRVCLVEAAHRDQLAPLFGVAPVGHKLTEVRPNLSVINLDHQQNFLDYVVKQLGLPSLIDKVFNRPVIQSLMEMLPGIAEIMLLGRLYYSLELSPEPFDLVIYDGFASGHFLNLMTTPDAILEADFAGPVAKETRRVRDFLAAKGNAGIVMVTRPEGLVVSETIEFLDKFKSVSPTPVVVVLCNRFAQLTSTAKDFVVPDAALEPAVRYLLARDAEMQRSFEQLREGMHAHNADMPLFTLAEHGLWHEPLDDKAVLAWLADAKEVRS